MEGKARQAQGSGARALGARNGRGGNARVNGSTRANAVGGARGKRGGRANGPNSGNVSDSGKESEAQGNGSPYSNGLIVPILTKKSIPEQYHRKNPVGSGSGVRGSNIPKALSSDYYLHKKFKKLTTALDEDEDGIGDLKKCDRVQDDSGSCSKKVDIAHSSCDQNSSRGGDSGSRNGEETSFLSTVKPQDAKEGGRPSRKDETQDLLNNKNDVDNGGSCSNVSVRDTKSLEIGQEQIRGDVGIPLSHSRSSSLNSSNPIDLTRGVAGGSPDNKSCNQKRDISLTEVENGATSNCASSNGVALNEGSNKTCGSTLVASETDDSSSSLPSKTAGGMPYKPKFRIATESSPSAADLSPKKSAEGNGRSAESPSPARQEGKGPALSKGSAAPERLNGDHRLDRKSLDDHISKLIDENQSILSTWPEHLKKRLKSQVQRVNDQQPSVNTAPNFSSSPARPQSSANPSSMVILSGGSTTENPVIEFPVTGNGLHRQYRQMCVSHGSVLPAQQIPFNIRSQADVSTFSPEQVMLKKGALTPLHIKERTHFGAPVNSYPTGGAVNIGMNLSPPAPIVGANGELNLTVVPKKRRRLSPTPSRLCGGEVSELPMNEPVALVSGKNGLYQDVDMTVRVSNCGTSGAKVTIRTSPNHSLNHVNPHVPLNYNHLMDAHTSPVKSSRMSSAVYPSNLLALHNAESVLLPPQALHRTKLVNPYDTSFNKDAQCKSALPEVPADLRLSKPKGRPPKKERAQEAQDAPESSKNLLMSSPCKYPLEIRTNSGGSSGAPSGLVKPKRDVTTPEPRHTKLSLSSSNVSPLRPGRPLTPIKIETNVKIEPEEQEERLGGPENSGDTNKSEKKEDVPSGSVFVESSPPNPKRPNFLAIRPTNFVSKKFQNGVLPSPDTPRVAKPYNQMHINGNAYTYLGFKVSTRSSYTCLFKPQPMFIPQETDPKLSMYSNWQPRPRNKSQDDIGIMTNDSRVNGRKSPRNMLYTSAGVKCETEIVNSPDKHSPLWSFGDLSPSTPTKPGPSKLIVPPASPTYSMKANGSQALPGAASSNVGSAANSLLKSAFTNSGNASSETTKHRVSPPSQTVNRVGGTSEDDIDVGTKVTGSETSSAGPSSSILLANRYLSDISSDDGESSNPATLPSTENRSRTFSENRGPFKVDDNAAKVEVGQDSQASSTIPDSNGDKRGAASPNLSNTNSSDDVDDERSSSGATNRYDHIPRVRIMEGGFESNEDYTYVRGRGRGRYVCEACGIRCKKPSMLRKHLKTHTDLRPYTCKLCNFSFKTKGNLTKHQKSKSHHKKCIGLGIHPESSQSLEMTGPTFSDTNTTDESEDDDGNETDSQEDIDVDDVSSSAETAQEIVAKPKEGSQTFEKEIAQSLLDLSKISRVQSDSAGDSQSTCSIPSESPVPVLPQQPRPVPPAEIANDSFYARNHKKFGPRNFNVEDTNSCSSFISAPDAPIDLSRPVSKPSFSEVSEHVSKKPKLELNGNVRSFGVVGEAQRWQPYNEFSITGCLNLKKIRNDNNIHVEDPSMRKPLPAGPPSSALSRETGAVSIKDEKPPVHVFDFSNHIPRGINGTPPMLSNSSTAHLGGISPHLRDVRPLNTVDTQPKDAPKNLPGPSRSSTAPAPQTPPPKPQKLHQPWLSPPNTKRPTEVSVSEVSPRGGATITPGKGMSSGEAVDRKIFETPADLLQRDGHTGALYGRPGSHLTSPNNKVLAQAAGLKPQAEFRQPNGPQAFVKDEGKAECGVCGKEFGKASQLNLHMHIHFMERPFKCEPCGISFRTKGHLIKHRRSSSHESKVKVFTNDSWGGGVANDDNPRPFKCGDCKIAFRIHGHLAKHLRSKMHILRMECLGKLPFGIYFEMEKSGLNLTEIDTSDCDLSLVSLQGVARKIYGESWRDRLQIPVEESV